MDRTVLTRGIGSLARGLIAAAFPAACTACDAGLDEAVRPALPLCAACTGELVDCGPAFCLTCARAGDSPRACARSGHLVLRAGFTWNEPLRAVVHAFKFGGAEALAGGLAVATWNGPAFDPAPRVDVVVPVPLHAVRRRERGYDQAAALAAALAAHAGVPVATALTRIVATRQQARLPAAARRANVVDAFALRTGADVRGRRVALVDDVVTTGATVDAAVRALKAEGARSVEAWCTAYEPLE